MPTRASGQPAFGYYLRDQPSPAEPSPVARGRALIVLTCAGDEIAAITRFRGSLLPFFGLPASLPADQVRRVRPGAPGLTVALLRLVS